MTTNVARQRMTPKNVTIAKRIAPHNVRTKPLRTHHTRLKSFEFIKHAPSPSPSPCVRAFGMIINYASIRWSTAHDGRTQHTRHMFRRRGAPQAHACPNIILLFNFGFEQRWSAHQKSKKKRRRRALKRLCGADRFRFQNIMFCHSTTTLSLSSLPIPPTFYPPTQARVQHTKHNASYCTTLYFRAPQSVPGARYRVRNASTMRIIIISVCCTFCSGAKAQKRERGFMHR